MVSIFLARDLVRKPVPTIRDHALVVQMSLADDSGRAHHVKDPGGEAEQQKHDEPPRRNSQPAVEQPADQRADDDTRDQLGRKPETARHRRSIGVLTRTAVVFGWSVRSCEPVAETLEPRGESSLVVRRFFTIAFAARAVSHAFDSRGFQVSRVPPP